MLKKTLIAAATAVALTGSVVATAAPAAAASATTIEISGKGGWNGHNQWKGHGGKYGGHKNKYGGHKKWNPRRACQPIIRWKKVGYRYHRRWQPIVVGWDCHRGRGGPKGPNHWGHNNGKWH